MQPYYILKRVVCVSYHRALKSQAENRRALINCFGRKRVKPLFQQDGATGRIAERIPEYEMGSASDRHAQTLGITGQWRYEEESKVKTSQNEVKAFYSLQV
jgi:hypothetical protein